jgi:hypothetical protein
VVDLSWRQTQRLQMERQSAPDQPNQVVLMLLNGFVSLLARSELETAVADSHTPHADYRHPLPRHSPARSAGEGRRDQSSPPL